MEPKNTYRNYSEFCGNKGLAQPGNTEVAWSLGELEGRQTVLTSCFYSELLLLSRWSSSCLIWQCSRFSFYRRENLHSPEEDLVLIACFCTVILFSPSPYPWRERRERERSERGRGGLGLCLHLKNFCHEPGCTLISYHIGTDCFWLVPAGSFCLSFFTAFACPSFVDGYIWVEALILKI